MNIQQASIYSGLSESTLRRKIYQGKLPVQKIEGRYEIAMSDLDALQAQPASDTLSIRLTDLERRVHVLEATITAMSSNTYPAQKHAPRLLRSRSEASESSILPDGLTPVSEVLKQLNLSRQRKAIVAYLEQKGLLRTGDWSLNGHAVNLAVDPEGIEEVKRRYVQ